MTIQINVLNGLNSIWPNRMLYARTFGPLLTVDYEIRYPDNPR